MVLPLSHNPSGKQSVAGNDGDSVRTTVEVKLLWIQLATERLAIPIYFGEFRTNRNIKT